MKNVGQQKAGSSENWKPGCEKS